MTAEGQMTRAARMTENDSRRLNDVKQMTTILLVKG